MKHRLPNWIAAVSLFALHPGFAAAQELRAPEVNWRRFSYSVLAHGAASGFDAWTSWQHVERNRLLANGGRFTASSAGKKAGIFAVMTLAETVVIKKWGHRHSWLERAFSIANFSSAGALATAGFHNLRIAAR